MHTLDPLWVAWAAGLFEGEGYISVSGPGTFKLGLASTDYDVLVRFHLIVDRGVVSARKNNNGRFGKKQIYYWGCTGVNAEHVYQILRPWLCQRRQARGDELVAQREAYKIVRATPLVCLECGDTFVRKFTDKKRLFCTVFCSKIHGRRHRELAKLV